MYSKVLVALIYIESTWNPLAISGVGAKGLGQMTPIAVKEVAKRCNYSPTPDLFHWETNLDYSACYLDYCMLKNNNDVSLALMCYNGGMRQVHRYKQGKLIATETLDYVYKVTRRIKHEEITIDLTSTYQRSKYSLRLSKNSNRRPHQDNKNQRSNTKPRGVKKETSVNDEFKGTDNNFNRLPRR